MNAVTKTTPETSTTAAVEPDTRNVHQRLLAVMAEVSYIQKDRAIGNYKVVTHDAVTAKVRPALVKHGVIYYPQNLEAVQNGNRTEMKLDIKFVNAADPSDFILVPSLGYGIDAQDKGPGKAVSYAVKMALLKALGLETGEDADDGTEEVHKPAPKAKNEPTPEPEAPAERQLTKQQARPEYDKLLKELQAQPTVTDLAAWGKRNKARVDAMPDDWQQSLKNEYSDHKSNLMGRAAQ